MEVDFLQSISIEERNEKMRSVLKQYAGSAANDPRKVEEMNRKLYEIQKEYYKQER